MWFVFKGNLICVFCIMFVILNGKTDFFNIFLFYIHFFTLIVKCAVLFCACVYDFNTKSLIILTVSIKINVLIVFN